MPCVLGTSQIDSVWRLQEVYLTIHLVYLTPLFDPANLKMENFIWPHFAHQHLFIKTSSFSSFEWNILSVVNILFYFLVLGKRLIWNETNCSCGTFVHKDCTIKIKQIAKSKVKELETIKINPMSWMHWQLWILMHVNGICMTCPVRVVVVTTLTNQRAGNWNALLDG